MIQKARLTEKETPKARLKVIQKARQMGRHSVRAKLMGSHFEMDLHLEKLKERQINWRWETLIAMVMRSEMQNPLWLEQISVRWVNH